MEHAGTSPTPTAPPPPTADGAARRIPALDVLRGIAIVGTLASNIWLFTDSLFPDSAADESIGAGLAAFLQWLPNGKFLGLLTIMFGIGLEIQRQAAVRAGRPWPGTYPVRAALLFVDGLLNYVLVVQFDVLRAYAVVGLTVAFLLLTSERVQWWLIGVFTTLHLAILTLPVLVERDTDALPTAADADDPRLAGIRPDWATDRMGWWDGAMANLSNLGEGFSWHSEFPLIVMMGLGTFLLGAKLYRTGIFEPHRAVLRRWLIGVGFLVALPADHFLGISEGPFASHSRYGTAVVVALGILALVAEFYQRRPVGWWGRRLGRVGAMALSCYVLQNVLALVLQTTVFDRGVLPMGNGVTFTVAAFVVIVVLLVVVSEVWLRLFRRGPLETVWHRSAQFIIGGLGRLAAARPRRRA